jgi:hypothetical protein
MSGRYLAQRPTACTFPQSTGNGCGQRKAGVTPSHTRREDSPLQPLDPEQLKYVEILAKLMMENEVFKEEYTEEDFNEVIDWLTKLRGQIDITIETLQAQEKFEPSLPLNKN